ncbi:MAG: hypothetical protein ABI039_10945 [Vicinamibacterales bacterium]
MGTHPTFTRAALGGFVGTLAMTAMMYGVAPMMGVIRGTIWGVVLWLIAQTVVMPMMGGGLFSSATGGMMATMESLIGHILFGSLFGVIAGAPEPRVVRA